MDAFFSKVLSMSYSACFVIVIVLLLRVLLYKAPKKYSYFLWFLVFIRLLCPFSIESRFSVMPIQENAIHYENKMDGSSVKVDTETENENLTIYIGSTEEKTSSMPEETSLFKTIISWLPIIWIMGVFTLVFIGILQVVRLKWRLRTAVLVKDINVNCPVYESDYIKTPFLFGVFRPRIYLPLGIDEHRDYVIEHEMMHKKRLDYIMKPICYFAVILHWFNPLVWISFCLMIKDMEMSCDEQVLMNAKVDIRGEYTRSLLSLSVAGSGLKMPLAFGETDTKERIRHALKYKKPSIWIGIVAVILIFVAAITLLTNRDSGDTNPPKAEEVPQEELFQQLSKNRNPHIGDAGKNSILISLLSGLESYQYKGMELKTSKEPYGLSINFDMTVPVSYSQELENAETIVKNTIYLFATIENMDICTYRLNNNGKIQEISYTREEWENIFGDLYEKSETPQGLMELEKEITSFIKQMSDLLGNIFEHEKMVINMEEDPVVAIDTLITQAILQNAGDVYGSYAEVHMILGDEQAVFQQLAQSDKEMVFYLMTVYGTGESISQTAAKITISHNEGGSLTVTEYWVPRSGSFYQEDIESEFPEEYWDDINSSEIWENLEKEFEKKAETYENR